MSEAQWWHPVAAGAALGQRPVAARLLDVDLAVWRDDSGAVSAFDDRCPHRGARLSLGHVRDGRLQCAYHGWCFDHDGHCVHVPALPAFTPPASCVARSRPAREALGLVWVRLSADTEAIDVGPALADLPARVIVCGPFDAATSAPRVVENFLDMSHFGFVHEGLLGDRSHFEVPDHVVGHTADGRPVVEHYRAWQPQASAGATEGGWIDYRYELLGPYAALLRKRGPGGSVDEAYALWVCPASPETSRVWFTLFTGDTETPASDLQRFQAAIFEQDRPIIESQRPKCLPIGGGEAMSAADRLSAAYRRYLHAQSISFGVC